jgi:hypothetical protein
MDSTSHWIYDKDENNGDVVGAMNWNIHEQNPFASGEEGPPIYWWPEGLWKNDDNIILYLLTFILIGPMKTLAEQFLGPFFANRPKHMSKPHVCKLAHPYSLSKSAIPLEMPNIS